MSDRLESNGYDPDELARFVERYENVQSELDELTHHYREECQPYREDMAHIKREAQDAGLGKREFAALLRKRRLEMKALKVSDALDLAQRANLAAMLETMDRLAEQIGPLGEVARDRARAETRGA